MRRLPTRQGIPRCKAASRYHQITAILVLRWGAQAGFHASFVPQLVLKSIFNSSFIFHQSLSLIRAQHPIVVMWNLSLIFRIRQSVIGCTFRLKWNETEIQWKQCSVSTVIPSLAHATTASARALFVSKWKHQIVTMVFFDFMGFKSNCKKKCAGSKIDFLFF